MYSLPNPFSHYFATEEGDIIGPRGKRKLSLDHHGYYRINLSSPGIKTKRVFVSRAVFCAFNGIPLDIDILVLHKNDIKTDNRIDNLFCGTTSDNMVDMFIKRKTGNKNVILNQDIVKEIKDRISKGMRNKEISQMFEIDQSIISRIRHGQVWKWC